MVRVCAERNELVRFEVSDTGIGIDRDEKERLWEPFTQADSSTTRTHGGAGLGLTISRQIVERMGGEHQRRVGARPWQHLRFQPAPASVFQADRAGAAQRARRAPSARRR